ncbi:hypothetical protein D9619_000097 [Psilocybe cf. subviscida]|uniref:DUF4203 domain-containing protein n=1 Tax=Psilocybe cf. subviscida TaxID=2480587 RepID=A0A8H5F2S9_9AGAR|nr:hypothetical protein D9619_000097 [Psilocybe cf. subviscida]
MGAAKLSQLTSLLMPTPYLLAYALPLLLISLLLTFSGTFLILDRSRSFPPAANGERSSTKGYNSLAPGRFPTFEKMKMKKGSINYHLEGGVGGLAGGFCFGVHFATALSLIIPGTTSSATLSAPAFCAVWVLSAIVFTALGGRWRVAGVLLLGISGGTLLALAICIITHPSLTARVILTGLFLPLLTVPLLLLTIFSAYAGSSLSLTRACDLLFHPMLRVCSASTGAFGIICSVALLLSPKQEGWANAWERLFLSSSPLADKYGDVSLPGTVGSGGRVVWGGGQEAGLSTAFVIFMLGGIAGDWALRRWIGGCPDQKWDAYLASYAASLPNNPDRAGTFEPPKSWWDRFFSSSSKSGKDILFPSETDMMKTALHGPSIPPPVISRSDSMLKQEKSSFELTRVPTGVERLKKKRGRRNTVWRVANGVSEDSGSNGERKGRKGRKPVKFGTPASSSSSDDDDELDKGGARRSHGDDAPKPAIARRFHSSSSTPTLVDAAPPSKLKYAVGRPKFSPRISSHDYALSTPSTSTSTPNDARLEFMPVLDYDTEIAQLKGRFGRTQTTVSPNGEVLDYSDFESETEQILAGRQQRPLSDPRRQYAGGVAKLARSPSARVEEWTPAFLARHASAASAKVTVPRMSEDAVLTPPPRPAPVPATPSLVRALDRLAAAQREAFGLAQGAPTEHGMGAEPASAASGASSDEDEYDDSQGKEPGGNAGETLALNVGKRQPRVVRAPRWEEFWRDVSGKAARS